MGHIMSAICDGNLATFLMRTFEDALVLVYEFFHVYYAQFGLCCRLNRFRHKSRKAESGHNS
jgi:hypothetical protein